jgi:hypothetical protein
VRKNNSFPLRQPVCQSDLAIQIRRMLDGAFEKMEVVNQYSFVAFLPYSAPANF